MILVTMYFTEKEKLWNEVAVLRPLPVCECRASKLFMDRKNDDEVL